MSFRLDDKVAVVTGAAMGIGKGCAISLADAGAKVIITDINEKAGQETATEIREAGGNAEFRMLDVTSETDWSETLTEIVQSHRGLDILVNNAGIFDSRMILDTTLEQWRKIITVDLESVFLGVREAIRVMQPSGIAGNGGTIVNMSSSAALKPSASHSAYSAAKGGVHMLTKVAALETVQMGIRVNSVHPAVVDTPMAGEAMKMWATMLAEGDVRATEKMVDEWHPLGRLAKTEEVGAAVLYLASDASAFATGIEIKVDGGFCM